MICKHCQERHVTRGRGLCYRCFYTPGVAALYPRLPPCGSRSPACFIQRARRPSSPTRAAPGTLEKQLVLAERVARGESLWHPQDAQAEDGDSPAIAAGEVQYR